MKHIGKIKAFTFIEVIIIVIIITIIGIIGFFTLTKYLQGARDSSKITSLNNIKTTLFNYKLNKGLYPEPSNNSSITYSGSVVWIQGVFGKDVIKKVNGSKEEFLDPYTKNEYTYSITSDKKEFQVAGVLGSSDSIESYDDLIISSTYAVKNKKVGKAIVLGDYNLRILNINIGGVNNILAIPSIIASNLSSTKLVDILNNNYLVYNNSANLPASYKDSIFNVDGGQNLASNNLIIFSGSLSDLKLESSRLILLDKLKKSYDGTLIQKIGKNYFKDLNINLLNPSSEVLSIACNIVEFNLDYPINCNSDSFFAVPIFNNLNLNIDFSGLISQKVNIVFQDNNNNIWFGTDKGISVYNPISSTWTSYTTSNGLVNNKVKIINQSLNGNIWIGTDKGISVYNPVSSSWVSYTTSNGLINNEIKVINQSSIGIWIGTDKGVSVYNSGNFTSYTSSNGLVNNKIKVITQSSSGNIWIGTDKGVSVYNSGNFTSYTSSNGLVNNEVKTINQLLNGNIWIGTDKGISVYNPISSTWTSYNNTLVSSDIKNIFQSLNGDIWIATNKGVSMFNGVSWLKYTVTDGLISNKVKSIFEDKNHNIWFITKKGLSKLVFGIFTNYPNGNNSGVYVVYKSNGITIIGIK